MNVQEPPPTISERLAAWWRRRRNFSKVAIIIGGLWATVYLIGVVFNTATTPNSDPATNLAPIPTPVQIATSPEICAARFHELILGRFNRNPNVMGNPYGLALAVQIDLLNEMPDCKEWHSQVELPPEIDCDWLLGPRMEPAVVRPIDMQICVLRSF